jgi:hypothetical protein
VVFEPFPSLLFHIIWTHFQSGLRSKFFNTYSNTDTNANNDPGDGRFRRSRTDNAGNKASGSVG